MRTLLTTVLTISLAFAAVLLCAGCKKSGTAGPAAAEIKAFDTAPPEVKQMWQAAVAADHTNDYAAGITLYYSLMREELTPEQQAVVAKLSTNLKQRMSDAADKGDPAAQAALQELRRHSPNRPQR
jgi:hypothetical protein